MGLAAESQMVGDLFAGKAFLQHGERCLKTLVQNIGMDRGSGFLFKQNRQIIIRQPDIGSQGMDCDLFM
jgi:hypothetical protein